MASIASNILQSQKVKYQGLNISPYLEGIEKVGKISFILHTSSRYRTENIRNMTLNRSDRQILPGQSMLAVWFKMSLMKNPSPLMLATTFGFQLSALLQDPTQATKKILRKLKQKIFPQKCIKQAQVMERNGELYKNTLELGSREIKIIFGNQQEKLNGRSQVYHWQSIVAIKAQ
ncbi:UNKNOWN [Stylonychia lemnae]|uniref:Uncharacterized protein n=1 Tax=Stylonychia lemnae TaxID=5949 RepID=A0A078B7Y8_STYLE|nr:UNKNOWN [Stylonychia lemnae]|eukprot:CDW90640.1 UNKNOWN [Stylonychia lemnae]